MKIAALIVLAIIASSSSFIVHVASVEWLPAWIANQMQGLTIQPSWDVRYLAAATSIEYGLAAVGLYYLAREKLLPLGKFKTACVFSALLMAIHGVLFRQPLMDMAIGNPWHVSLVQNSFQWLPWILMGFITVLGYEMIHQLLSHKQHTNRS